MNIRPTTPADQTIAERLDEIERVLKFDPNHEYRRLLIREYLALTTDPNELPSEAAKWRRQRT